MASIYAQLIVEATKCKPEEARRIEETMRDFPGCSTLDHLTRRQFFKLAREAQAWLISSGS
jgi:hypothetical protein